LQVKREPAHGHAGFLARGPGDGRGNHDRPATAATAQQKSAITAPQR
jgi:hypothetical protein